MSAITSKTCGRCRRDLPVSDFYRNRKAPDGLQYACKTCTKEYAKNPGPARRKRTRVYGEDGVLVSKECVRCEEVLPVAAFAVREASGDGLQTACKECIKVYMAKRVEDPEVRARYLARKRAKYEQNRERERERSRKDRAANPEKYSLIARRHLIKKKYGLTLEDFDALVERQDARCAVCRSEFDRTPHVDHCHSSGRVRALLCGPCNTAIGSLRDDPVLIRAAADYVEYWSVVHESEGPRVGVS